MNKQERQKIVAEVIHNRRSVRRFSKEPISGNDIQDLLAAGIAAPSGSNWQNQRFLPLTSKEEIECLGKGRFVWPYKSDQSRMRDLHPAGIIGNATAVIVVFSEAAENDRRGNGEYYIWETLEVQNCSAAIENILLMATAKGIGSCWISASDKMNYTRMLSKGPWRRFFSDRFRIPASWKLQGIVILGYPEREDDLGYPKGEKMHGATQWMSTNRHPVDYYLPETVTGLEGASVRQPNSLTRLTLLCLSTFIRVLLFIARLADRLIHKIEMPLVDLSYHEKRRAK